MSRLRPASASHTARLAVSGTAEAVDASDTATGTIRDDDALAVTITDEGGSSSFVVTLNGTGPGDLNVTPSFTGGTAPEGEAQSRRTFRVATIQDEIVEGA